MEMKNVKDKPKVGLVNEQFKGELVGQKTNMSTDSLAIANRMQSQQLATDSKMVNEQVRGELAGKHHKHFSHRMWLVQMKPTQTQQQQDKRPL